MASLFSRLSGGLSKTRQRLGTWFPTKRKTLSDNDWIAIEDALISADCGASLSDSLIKKAKKTNTLEGLESAMLSEMPPQSEFILPQKKPFILLVVGVNGTGKTTSIGKLAAMFKAQNKRVIIGAADTFRAAATEQLALWAERAGADIVRQHDGADPSAVAFDTIKRGLARNYDVIIIDTAGRVQTDAGLMQELAKVQRVIGKAYAGAPHEVWQVLDASTGQNAVAQLGKFRQTAKVSGIIITKLDGSAKGGVVLQLIARFGIPVRYIGVGETMDDLLPFSANDFVRSLLPTIDKD
ncbi:MAG: signal recognition particle-docking protein FtsY [Mariprofundales bacterium]